MIIRAYLLPSSCAVCDVDLKAIWLTIGDDPRALCLKCGTTGTVVNAALPTVPGYPPSVSLRKIQADREREQKIGEAA